MAINSEQDLSSSDFLRSMAPITSVAEINWSVSSNGRAMVVERPGVTMDQYSRRVLTIGGEHRQLMQILPSVLLMRSDLQPPLKLVNADMHTDDTPGASLNASWQSVLNVKGITTPGTAISLLPQKEVYSLTGETEVLNAEAMLARMEKGYKPDVLSVDMDFFNTDRSVRGRRKLNLGTVEQLATLAGVTMVFTSPSFTEHNETVELTRNIYRRVITSPIDPRQQP